MPRPEVKMVTFSIDGREVTAPANAMLVDGAKYGDVEIPVFCYEPKLGQPVGACRMCLVEIEGIPKLQTACSTPVKDGMVVHTQTERVRTAQEAVVEFLLINHPLDCPVCDKGGECPLQDISFGWGGGRSRFIEPKRHFQKPLELSPLIAIDRERCILCYRCVRFSQEISEDYQLVLSERGADTFVSTFDGHPYVAPFSGNIIELCPVGALTSRPYRFRARPWDIEGSGSVCTLCPSQCNVTFTVRDDRVLRVLGRDHDGVDDGWLCDKGRFAYQAINSDERITTPLVRDGDTLRPATWERALEAAASGLRRAKGRVGAIAGGESTNEEGFLLQRIVREALQSPHLDSQGGASAPLAVHRALSDPALQAEVSDLEFAHTVLVLDTEPVDDMPILDLRIRKGVRRNRVRLVVAGPRPSSLDDNAATRLRYAPGQSGAVAMGLAAALGADDSTHPGLEDHARAAGVDADDLRAVAEALRSGGDDVVILASERVGAPLAALAEALGLRGREGAGLIVVPAGGTNGRGLREAGMLPDAGPGLSPTAVTGSDAAGIAAAAADGELAALYLLHVDPSRDLPGAALWDRALDKASTVIAHAAFLSDSLLEHATVIFPAEAYAAKDGTVTHPDGRVQRLRPAIGHAGEGRYEWQVLAELASMLGLDTGVHTAPMAFAQLTAAAPFLTGITLDEIGGRGVRWPTRDGVAWTADAEGMGGGRFPLPAPAASPNGKLRLGTFRSIWASPEVEVSPALKFLHPGQTVEMSPRDAQRHGLRHGQHVSVRADEGTVSATVVLRDAIPDGSVFLQDGIPRDAANVLSAGMVEVLPR